jgi:HPt (histidine-containing phosphotransfer) domain-containing protein
MSSVEENLLRLRQRFLDRSSGELYTLKTEREREALRLVVHRMAGAAGTFGFPDLSRIAGEIDDALVEGKSVGDAEMAPLIAELERVLAQG